MSNHVRAIVLLTFSMLQFTTAAAQESSNSRYQPKNTLPSVAVAKIDGNSPNKLLLRIPGVRKELRETTWNTDGKQGTVPFTIDVPGELVASDVLLQDVEFRDLDGKEVAHAKAVTLLAKPTHVLLNRMPDDFYKSVLRNDILVILPKSGKFILEPQPVWPKYPDYYIRK